MSIKISFMTIVLLKSCVKKSYPGGIQLFKESFPDATEDEFLYGLVYMSSGEAQETLDALSLNGIDAAKCCAVGDFMSGEIDHHPKIVFSNQGKDFPPVWVARYEDNRYLNMVTKKFCNSEEELRAELKDVPGVARAIPTRSDQQALIAIGGYFTVEAAVRACSLLCENSQEDMEWLARTRQHPEEKKYED